MSVLLTTADHSRDVAGLKYVYPVISRRSGGLSIGINVNTNNACNWRCIYCQVPDLIRGSAPEVDFELMRQELIFLLNDIQKGDFYTRFEIPSAQRSIRDIALSGNGEPTSVTQFEQLVSVIGEAVKQVELPSKPELVLITNGSLIHRKTVQRGLIKFNELQGQVWFKLDSATAEGRRRINNAAITQRKYIDNLLTTAKLCPTWLQTCLFMIDGKPPEQLALTAYLDLLGAIMNEVDLQGVLLYTIARPSMQPEADRLAPLSEKQLRQFAAAVRALGLTVKVSV